MCVWHFIVKSYIGNSTFILKCSVYDINLIKNPELKKYCENLVASEDVYM